MSQDDLSVANAAGSTVRADINAQLQALGTLMSGATAPATTYARMLWADTTTNTLKRRNAANSGWIKVRSLDETFVLSRSSNTILGESDIGKTIVATSGFTQTLTAVATLGDGWWCAYRVEYGATIVFDPNASENIDGAATKTVVGPEQGLIFCNGSAFFTVGFPTPAAAWVPTDGSGAALSFTSITAKFKIEKGMLYFQVGLTWPATANGSNAQINGLPVAPLADTAGSMLDNSGAAIIPYFNAGNIHLYAQGAFTRMTNAQMSGKQIFISGAYAIT